MDDISNYVRYTCLCVSIICANHLPLSMLVFVGVDLSVNHLYVNLLQYIVEDELMTLTDLQQRLGQLLAIHETNQCSYS